MADIRTQMIPADGSDRAVLTRAELRKIRCGQRTRRNVLRQPRERAAPARALHHPRARPHLGIQARSGEGRSEDSPGAGCGSHGYLAPSATPDLSRHGRRRQADRDCCSNDICSTCQFSGGSIPSLARRCQAMPRGFRRITRDECSLDVPCLVRRSPEGRRRGMRVRRCTHALQTCDGEAAVASRGRTWTGATRR